MRDVRVLISGASVAGPVLAYWLARYGATVTVVEQAEALRTGGQLVDIRGDAAYGGNLLSAEVTVHWPGVGRRTALDLIARAEERDPCSKMARRGLSSTTRLDEAAVRQSVSPGNGAA